MEEPGGGDDGGMAEIADVPDPEDSVTQGLVIVQSVQHVLVQAGAL